MSEEVAKEFYRDIYASQKSAEDHERPEENLKFSTPLETLLATICMFAQCTRRFWETHFLQIFSRSSRINIAHYLVGYIHYFGALVAILGHAQGFVMTSGSALVSREQFTWRIIISTAIFAFAWWHQWRSNVILARLRTDSNGNVVTEKHLMPTGGFFEIISSPHMMFECLIYLSLIPMLPGNALWLLICAWMSCKALLTFQERKLSVTVELDTPLEALLAIICIFAQCFRRFWETHFLQTFSRSSCMHIIHYFISYLHYFGVPLATLNNAQGFVTTTGNTLVSREQFTWRIIIPTAVFAFAWWHQFRSNVILARLRRDSKGNVVTEKHSIPRGGFFEVVSSPHMMFECLIYLSLILMLPGNTLWLLICLWVVSNQCQVAHWTHEWYKENFPEYPKERKAIIPWTF
uniref:Polyprenal reductase n=1 Tax=Phlebotomus papatasi TaxID=29031 RepID=A0A1B0DIY8_PHLPP